MILLVVVVGLVVLVAAPCLALLVVVERRPVGPPAVRRAVAGPDERLVLPGGSEGHLAFADDLVTAAVLYRNECARRAAAGDQAASVG